MTSALTAANQQYVIIIGRPTLCVTVFNQNSLKTNKKNMALIFKMTHCNEHCCASRLETIHMRQRYDKCAQFQIMLIVNWDSTLNIPAHRTQITYVKLSVTLVIAWINHKYQDCNNLKISIRRKCVFVTLEFGFRNICDYFPKFWNSCSWSIYQIEWKRWEREKKHTYAHKFIWPLAAV